MDVTTIAILVVVAVLVLVLAVLWVQRRRRRGGLKVVANPQAPGDGEAT
ncbi:hypothetical protein [Euzebya sp.]